MAELYEKGLALFEAEQYDEAVSYMIQAYKTEDCKDEILGFLYSCFITPNEGEFKDNYNQNIKGISSIAYDELELDFIPVAEDKFYIFDKVTKTFEGSFTINDLPDGFEENFNCLLVKDYWNIASFSEDLDIRKWNTTYIVVGENKNKFLSFCKLPDFSQKYLYNACLVESMEALETVFRQNDSLYLPRRILAKNRKECMSMIEDIHLSRISKKDFKSDNIFLSICIPSYNRGKFALRDVKEILKTKYDAEIEIIVSDNHSENTSGYDELSNIEDSRFIYSRAAENKGFIGNVFKLLSMARGHFAVLCSDDDFMKIENLESYLKALHNRRDAGFILTSGTGPNFNPSEDFYKFDRGSSAHSGAINSNYLTGSTFNMDIIAKENIIERIDACKDMNFVKTYIHCAFAVLCSEKTECWYLGIDLWNAENGAEDNAKVKIYENYACPKARIEQLNSAIEFIFKSVNVSNDEMIDLVIERIHKSYHLTRIAAINLGEFFYQEYNYVEAMYYLHKNNIEQISRYSDKLGTNLIDWIKLLEEIFYRYLGRNNMGACSEKEIAASAILLEIIKYKNNKGTFIHEMNIDDMKEKVLKLL